MRKQTEISDIERQTTEEYQIDKYGVHRALREGDYVPDFDRPCPECGGSGITTHTVLEPDGEGGMIPVREGCICPTCQ